MSMKAPSVRIHQFSSNSKYLFQLFRMAPELIAITGNPNVSYWSLEAGYTEMANNDGYPIRVFNSRHAAVLVVYLCLYEKDSEYLCRGSVQGFEVILRTPGQILKTLRHTFRVPLSEEAEIWITPKLITTSDELRSYTPNERKCFFQY